MEIRAPGPHKLFGVVRRFQHQASSAPFDCQIHGSWVCGQSSDRVRSLANHQLEETMLSRTDNTETSIRTDLHAIFVSLE